MVLLTRFGNNIQMRYINVSLGSHAPKSTLIRWMSSSSLSTKLFIGGLSCDTNETILKNAFEAHGEVIEARVICDLRSSESKGYGFVRFTSETAASKALEEMNGQLLDGTYIRVQYAYNQ